MFYGLHADVRKRCKKLIRRLKKGETWQSIMAELEADMMDIDEDPDAYLMVVGGPGRRGGEEHFRFQFLLHEIEINGSDWEALANEVVLSSLAKDWGMLLMLDALSGLESARHVAILEALQRHWDALVAVGKRYSWGGLTPVLLNENPTVIQFVLARNGTDIEALTNEPTLEYLRSQLPIALENARKAQRELEGTLN